jgi:hypothetical protein
MSMPLHHQQAQQHDVNAANDADLVTPTPTPRGAPSNPYESPSTLNINSDESTPLLSSSPAATAISSPNPRADSDSSTSSSNYWRPYLFIPIIIIFGFAYSMVSLFLVAFLISHCVTYHLCLPRSLLNILCINVFPPYDNKTCTTFT